MAIIAYERPQVIIIYNIKCAQTTLMRVFGGHTQGIMKGVPWDKNADSYFKKPWWISSQAKISKFPNYFTAIFVRNPYDRMISFWNALSKQQKMPGFDKYLRIVYDDWKTGISHYQYPLGLSYFVDDFSRINFIGKQERLDTDVKYIANKFGITYKGIPVLNKKQTKKLDLYTSELKNIVAEMYEKDFDLFDYEI